MWGAEAGWWCGALAAAAVLLALAACRTRRKHTTQQVQLVLPPPLPLVARAGPAPRLALRAPLRPLAGPLRPLHPSLRPPTAPRRLFAALSRAPAPGDDPPPQPPQIVIVRNTNTPEPTTSQTVPKLPLPEQWIHKRPIEYKYTTIPRPLAQLNADLGADLSQESRAKKYSATRSPSLEKDEKSPFVTSAHSEVFGFESEVFGFDSESVRKLSEERAMASRDDHDSPGNLKRFKSVSTRLNMCSVNEAHFENQQERLEMQNSPRVVECSSAKEKTQKFDFSPKLLDTLSSPRFFTPPETVSPMFFNEPSPKSVYYDTVRSPKFFPETPRDTEVPQSPRALGDHLNRNGIEKPSSPRVLSARPSPKIHSYNKENYFTFEQSCVDESRRPKKYGGRNSIERERFTPPADKDVRKYKRHNSCDTYKTVEHNITKEKDNKETDDEDVVDCCVEIATLDINKPEEKINELTPDTGNTAQARRQRLKSISLDSDNAKIIEQNLGLPIAKQMKDQMNEAYKNDVSASCESIERYPTPTNERPCFKFDETKTETVEEEPKSPDIKQKKSLRQSSDTQAFIDMPRFSPKEFEITVTSEEGATTAAETNIKPKSKNLRNLTIDLTKRDSDLEKELLEFEKLYTDAEEKKVKTPTLKVKATSLDSSETVNLSLPQKKTLDVPQNSVSVPNTPKRQLKRILAQKNVKHDFCTGKLGFNSIQSAAEQRRLFMKGQDSGIYLREQHANLMLYQPGTSRMGSRTMGSFDENTQDFENTPEINICGADNRPYLDSGQGLGSNLLNYKQNLSVSSTNLKTLPEGVPSDDFEPTEDEKVVKKLHRRNSNQSLMLSTHSLQSSNCSLNSSGASCHNIATVRTSISNFSLNDSRQKKLFERRDSNTSLINTEHLTPTTRVICSSNTNISDNSKNCLLQRRGSNNSLTLNIHSSTLSRHSSNTSLNKDAKTSQKKGLLERRSSNTSLTLNINNSNPQLSVNRGLSISNYNLNGSTCNLSRYNSNHSIDNANVEPRKGILERRSSNTSLTLNIQPQEPVEPRDIEIDETLIDPNTLEEIPHRDKHRKSLSTENLIPKSYKSRNRRADKCAFGSHDNLWSTSYTEQDYPRNLTYVCGDQENEIIYAFGAQNDPNYQPGFVKNITTKPLSPQSTSEDFKLYLANMQHLQNASSVLTRKQLKDLNDVFQNGYSKVRCHSSLDGQHCCSGQVQHLSTENPQMVIPEISQPCSEYQKMLLRNLHQEFWDMPTNFQEKPIVSGSHTKNRYKTILPNEHSRFILRADAGSTEGYINANFIKGHEYTKNSYIATQGPLQNTMYDFWLMVHQNSSNAANFTLHQPSTSRATATNFTPLQKIVMLTNFVENNRQKCEKYFPLELDEEVVVDSPESDAAFVIRNKGMIRKAGYTIRKLIVTFRSHGESGSKSHNESHGKVVSETSLLHRGSHSESGSKNPLKIDSERHSKVDSVSRRESYIKTDSEYGKSHMKIDSESHSKVASESRRSSHSEFGSKSYMKMDSESHSKLDSESRLSSHSESSSKSHMKIDSESGKSNMKTDSEVDTEIYRSSVGNKTHSESGSKSESDFKSELSDSSVTVYHYWFHNWADHKCPKDVNALLNLSLDVLRETHYDFDNVESESQIQCRCESPKPESKFLFPPLENPVPCEVNVDISSPVDINYESTSPATIIHCSAGIGRTGCLIAILNGIKQLANEQKVDVLGIVCNMRLNRGGMVQNSEQYELIHKVLCLYEQACLPDL